MLIFADTDGFRLNLDELCKRILQSSGNGNRAPQRNIIIRELLCRQLGRRIDRCARLTDDHICSFAFRELVQNLGNDLFRFA